MLAPALEVPPFFKKSSNAEDVEVLVVTLIRHETDDGVVVG